MIPVRKSDRNDLIHLLHIYRIFSITPNFNFHKKKVVYSTWRNSYAVATICFVVIFYFISVIGRIKTHYFEIDGLNVFLDILNYLLLTITNILLVCNCLLKRNLWSKFLNAFLDTDNDTSIGRYFVYLKLLLLHILYVTLLIFDIYVWTSSHGIEKYIFYFFRFIQEYHCVLGLILLQCFNSMLKTRFEILNRKVSRTASYLKVCKDKKIFFVREISYNKSGTFVNMDISKTIQSYDKLCSIIEMFNQIFGWQILFLLIHSSVDALDNLEKALMYKRLATSKVAGNREFAICIFFASLAMVSTTGVFI